MSFLSRFAAAFAVPTTFVVAIIATGTGGLAPTVDIPLVFNANITVVAVGQQVLNKNFPAPIHYRWPEYVSTPRGEEWWLPRGA